MSIPAIVLVVAVVVVALTAGSGHKKPIPARFTPHSHSTPTVTSTAPKTTGTTATNPANGGGPDQLASLKLHSPTDAEGTAGVAQVMRTQGVASIIVIAQGMPANGEHNAYAIWLRNSNTGASKIVGYLTTKVGKDGKLETEGPLPANAASYNQALVTLETQQNPAQPGQVVLSGPFREKQ